MIWSNKLLDFPVLKREKASDFKSKAFFGFLPKI